MKYCYYCRKRRGKAAVYGLHQACFVKWFGLPKILPFESLDPKKTGTSSASSEIDKKKDSFYHGRYSKYSAELGGVDYILKVQENDFPELPAMEYVCNRIASWLSIKVPDYYLIDFGERPAFVTKNFMQGRIGTLNHLYKFLVKGEEYSCQNIIKVIAAKTGKTSEAIRFVEICLFDALIGNNDRHGRNLGIVNTSQGNGLAPMYDNPSYLGVEKQDLLGADINPSGKVWTKNSKEPKLEDYLFEFKRLGLSSVCAAFAKRLFAGFGHIVTEVADSPLSEKRKAAFLNFLEKKLMELERGQK